MTVRGRYLLGTGVTLFATVFLFLALRLPFGRRASVEVPHPPDHPAPAPAEFIVHNVPETDPPGVFEWETRSAFDPVNIKDAQSATLEELCASFPRHILDQVQTVMKTGHGVLDSRIDPHLGSVSACLHNLLMFSDLEEDYEGRHVIDVFQDIPSHLTSESDQLEAWRRLNAAAANGTLDQYVPAKRDGWKTDKFKFLAGVSRAWHERPERKWYIFFEGDTYIFWDNLFRLLEHFNPDEPLYFGSPSTGRNDTWFANGGPGAVISRGAMRRLVADDVDEKSGHYIGSILSEKEWYYLTHDCCGDSILGWSLAQRDVFLSGLYPLFNPHSPQGVPFLERHWCQPIVTMHKPVEADMSELWRWEWTQRQRDRPLLYRDLALHHNLTSISSRTDWHNGGVDTFEPPIPSPAYAHDPHASPDACASACEAHERCFQWNYHKRVCVFTRIFRLGVARTPEVLEPSEADQTQPDWTEEDLRYISGWDSKMIQKWIDDHPCDEPQWVRPSIKRIF